MFWHDALEKGNMDNRTAFGSLNKMSLTELGMDRHHDRTEAATVVD